MVAVLSNELPPVVNVGPHPLVFLEAKVLFGNGHNVRIDLHHIDAQLREMGVQQTGYCPAT